ncbi:PREDICTED: uncharacterized protein LOC105568686 isoform X1 [Vollenhovia emeryi]|uniref:uncharacterized protein LOC105568686 isoform X1 n=1 Tax=Vollenhovia emeryi TaxID=411798 RepID=UPI0005F570AA|nr:PREDICTED: uncharacterized protein LOC105568686 isoform X1 [Vollenhovia emeryi]
MIFRAFRGISHRVRECPKFRAIEDFRECVSATRKSERRSRPRRHRATAGKTWVTPESIIIPIVSCILGFPLLALMVICCLRRRAKLARERARRRNCDLDHGALSLVRFSPVHRLAGVDRPARTVSLRGDRGSRAFSSLELDTVVEERSDPEQSTALELSSPD